MHVPIPEWAHSLYLLNMFSDKTISRPRVENVMETHFKCDGNPHRREEPFAGLFLIKVKQRLEGKERAVRTLQGGFYLSFNIVVDKRKEGYLVSSTECRLLCNSPFRKDAILECIFIYHNLFYMIIIVYHCCYCMPIY